MNVPEFIEKARAESSRDFLTGANYLKQALEIIESQRAALESIDGHILADKDKEFSIIRAGLESSLADSRDALNTEVKRSVAAEERCRELESRACNLDACTLNKRLSADNVALREKLGDSANHVCLKSKPSPSTPLDECPCTLETVILQLKHHRETHSEWAEWFEKHPDDPCASKEFGDADFHRKTEHHYTQMIEFLAALKEATDEINK